MPTTELASLIKTFIQKEVIKEISANAGANSSQIKTAMQAALPKLLEGLANNSQSEEGAKSLIEALGQHNGEPLKNILEMIQDNNTQVDGSKILGHIFGEKQNSVVENIASKSNISSSQSSNVLQTVAPLLMEALGQTKQTQGLNTENISSFLLALLDQNKDGHYKDDLWNMFVNWVKGLFFK